MKKMKSCLLFLVIILTLGLYGCDYIELTEEDTNRIAEYMAGKLLEYDRAYSEKLIASTEGEGEEEPTATPEPTVAPTEAPEETAEPDDGEKQEKPEDSKDDNSSTSLKDFMKAEGFELSYNHSELHPSYPGDKATSDFVVEAEKDKQLLVLFFDLKNLSEKEVTLSMIEKKYSYYLETENNGNLKPLMTFLVQDLQYYEDTFKAGEKKKVILLFSIDKNGTEKGNRFVIEKDEISAGIKL